ncbi:putative zinc-type alcohol dehydrogenase [Trichoderma lentiforme]|uniref:Zinc-type alcohol dehydrogenase n=1 Tax=Trichoderma lentiforme TaxID=1567552 RepID=A0A9P4X3B6_9HYPO|nr:putative zinc-type alcohol dehydrogenase [Trichoderma lentiforme]
MAQSIPITFGTGTPGYGGLQAEYALVPFADDSLIPIPITSQNTSAELDYLMTSDIFTMAWGALTYSGFQPGDSVAIFGTGPVDLLAVYSALLRGVTRVYSVDRVQSRLDKARELGAIPINFGETDPAAEILEREPNGVNRSLDCVGFEAVNASRQLENGTVINQMINVTAFGGGMAIGGVWNGGANSTAGGPLLGNLPDQVPFSLPSLWRKALTIGTGIVLPLELAEPVIQMIHSGKAILGFVVSGEISIEEAPEYY